MALVESLMLSSSALPASKFSDAYNELMSFDVKAKCLGFARDFEVYVKIWHIIFYFYLYVGSSVDYDHGRCLIKHLRFTLKHGM